MCKAVFGFLLLQCSLFSIAENKEVTLAFFEFKPYMSKQLPSNGLATDIINEAFKRGGWNLTIKTYPTLRASRNVASGVVDGYMMATTNYPNELFVYSQPIITTNLLLAGSVSHSFEFTGIESLNDKKIGSVLGWGLSNAFPQLDWTEVNSIDQLLIMLNYGRIDALMYEQIAFEYSVSQLEKEDQNNTQIIYPQVASVDYGIAIDVHHLDADNIISGFNAGLLSMKLDGTLDSKISKYSAK